MYRSGNVLFLILLAVALFAALSYAVTQSSRSGGKDISDEDARLVASQILQATAQIRAGIDRLRLINGCRHNQISFQDDENHGSHYDNVNAPDDQSCHLFYPDGAGIILHQVTEDWLAPYTGQPSYDTRWNFRNIDATEAHQVVGVGTDDQGEAVMQITYPSLKVCEAINSMLGIPNPPPVDSGQVWGDEAIEFIGKHDFCRDAGGGVYQFIGVAIPR